MTKLAFCERVTATATSPWHIRRVGPEGLKLGGNAPDTTLCGASLGKGWDLKTPVTDEMVQRLGNAACWGCRDAYWREPRGWHRLGIPHVLAINFGPYPAVGVHMHGHIEWSRRSVCVHTRRHTVLVCWGSMA